MREGNILNGNYLHFNTKIIDFILINYGLNNYFFTKIKQRLEFFKKSENLININKKWIFLMKFFKKLIPRKKNIWKKTIINKYILNLIYTYRGVRQLMLLPSRGQRTWSNANTPFRSFNYIRNKKIELFKKYLIGSSEFIFYYNLEFFNDLWRRNWNYKWLEAEYSRSNMDKKRQFDKNFLFLKIKDSKKNMNFAIGFKPGFSKIIVKNNILKNKKSKRNKK